MKVLLTEKQIKRTKHKVTESQASQDALEKYITGGERGELPMSYDGADVTRPITAEQIAKFLKCPDCKNGSKENPIVVSIQVKISRGERRCITLCGKHWIKLSDTVVGWGGE